MSLKLYFDLLSQPSRALLILLRSSKIPFEQCPVALRKGEHLSETYKNISRFQKVPAIKDGDFLLAESVAILRYLAREKQLPDNWYPKNGKAQSKVDEYLEWQHIGLRAPCSLFFRINFIEPVLTGEQPHPKKVERYEKSMIKALDDFEELWLKSSEYVVGNQLSAADLWAACEIEQVRACNYDPALGRPLLKDWLNNVRQSLSPYYEEAHAILNKMAKGAAERANSKL